MKKPAKLRALGKKRDFIYIRYQKNCPNMQEPPSSQVPDAHILAIFLLHRLNFHGNLVVRFLDNQVDLPSVRGYGN